MDIEIVRLYELLIVGYSDGRCKYLIIVMWKLTHIKYVLKFDMRGSGDFNLLVLKKIISVDFLQLVDLYFTCGDHLKKVRLGSLDW